MLPHTYACTCCDTRFEFAQREARYYFNFDEAPLGNQLPSADLFEVPVRPAWCKSCATVCLVEDIQPVRTFEHAYGAARAGQVVEYPSATDNLYPQQAQDELAAFLRWRLGRRHPPRALCCGGTNYQFLDVPQPLFKHAECDFGAIEPRLLFIGSYNGPGPGVYSAANIHVYSGEGERIGLLTWRDQRADVWDIVPAAYPRLDEE